MNTPTPANVVLNAAKCKNQPQLGAGKASASKPSKPRTSFGRRPSAPPLPAALIAEMQTPANTPNQDFDCTDYPHGLLVHAFGMSWWIERNFSAAFTVCEHEGRWVPSLALAMAKNPHSIVGFDFDNTVSTSRSPNGCACPLGPGDVRALDCLSSLGVHPEGVVPVIMTNQGHIAYDREGIKHGARRSFGRIAEALSQAGLPLDAVPVLACPSVRSSWYKPGTGMFDFARRCAHPGALEGDVRVNGVKCVCQEPEKEHKLFYFGDARQPPRTNDVDLAVAAGAEFHTELEVADWVKHVCK